MTRADFLLLFAAISTSAVGIADPDCALSPLPSLPSTGPVRALAAQGDLALGARLLGTDVVTIDAQGALTPLTSVASPTIFPFTCHTISIEGDRAITLRGTGLVGPTRVELFDISDPESPTPISDAYLVSDFIVRRIALRGQHAFVLLESAQSGSREIQVLDLSAPNFPFLLNSAKNPGGGDFVMGEAVIYSVGSGVVPYSTSDPTELTQVGPWTGPWEMNNVGLAAVIADDRIYVRNQIGQIATVDISSAAAPVNLGVSAMGVFASSQSYFADFGDLAAHNGVVYLAGLGDDLKSAWLSAVDVSDPANPTEITRIPLPESSAYPIEITPRGVLVGADGFLHFAFITCPCPGDTDGDGFIGFKDLNTVLSAFNTAKGRPGYNAAADINGDGAVDFADVNVMISAFNTAC